jgi:glycosyltransferase involved in cell wall biosynthesis
MRIAFITQQTPYGKGEGFIIDELIEFAQQGHDITVFPMRPEADVYHSDAKMIRGHAVSMPLITVPLILLFYKFIILQPGKALYIAKTLLHSRSPGILIKNVAVLPKAIWIAQQIRSRGIGHIHAYWASTSATAGMIVSYLSGVSWSFTCYRWDVADDNLLALKHQSAEFIRCPDEQSRAEVTSICKLRDLGKLHLIRSGIRIPTAMSYPAPDGNASQQKPFRFAVPAMMVEKKGHVYLLDAIRLLADKGYVFTCWLIGDGPLREKVEERIRHLKIDAFVEMKGQLRLEEMRSIYQAHLVDVVVLPSIVTADNQKEGIPASLIDALSYGVPVVSTMTGGIPELVTPDVGLLVEPRNPVELAHGMEHLMNHPDTIRQMSVAARQRIEEHFDVVAVVRHMSELMQSQASEDRLR